MKDFILRSNTLITLLAISLVTLAIQCWLYTLRPTTLFHVYLWGGWSFILICGLIWKHLIYKK